MRRGPRQHLLSSDLRPARFEADTTWALYGQPLRAVYPCCGGPARFTVVNDLPKETYDRRCPHCDTKWTVTRESISRGKDVRVDRLEWETSRVEIHAKNRRALLTKKEIQ